MSDVSDDTKYNLVLSIGKGITYSKYNNLLHFIDVVDAYWKNPDLN